MYSRIVWFDLNETSHALLANHSSEGARAWQPHAVKILPSEDGYDDELQIEAIWFGKKACTGQVEGPPGARIFNPDDARVDISIASIEGIDPECAYGELPNARSYLNRNSKCTPRKRPINAGDILEPFPSQPGARPRFPDPIGVCCLPRVFYRRVHDACVDGGQPQGPSERVSADRSSRGQACPD